MAALFQQTEYDVQQVADVKVQVPDNPTAKLMYYLNCILSVLDINDAEFQRYKNFRNYYTMTRAEKTALIRICVLLGPDVLNDKVIFENNSIDEPNKFFKVGQSKISVAAVNSIIIGGASRRVLEIMIYTRDWIMRFFYAPLRELNQELNPPAITYPQTNYNSSCDHYYEDNYCTVGGICCCLCFFPLGLLCNLICNFFCLICIYILICFEGLPLCKERKCRKCGRRND